MWACGRKYDTRDSNKQDDLVVHTSCVFLLVEVPHGRYTLLAEDVAQRLDLDRIRELGHHGNPR